jgi:recombination protein RecA
MASVEDIAASIASLIGENDEPSTVTVFLSTGYPELDYALSNLWEGGIAGGRMVEIAGPPSAGKTAIATAIMAHAQRMGGIAGFMDHERSFSMKLAPQLGLDIRPGKFIYRKPRTFEESITIAVEVARHIRKNKLIDAKAPIVWVFDSLAAMVPQSALIDAKTGKDKEAGDRNMNDNTALARATSAHFPALAQSADDLGICMIFLNQIRIDLKVLYGDNRKTAGGDNSKFYFSQRIMLSASKITKSSTDKEVVGMQISAVINKNKVARPFRTASWRFEFLPDGTGKFNVFRSTIDFLVKEKVLESSAGYVKWEGGKSYPGPLADRLEKAGEWSKLLALLPKGYTPPVVAEIEEEAA